MQNKSAFGAIAAASATMGLLFSASPASAQTAEDFVPDCASGILAYSPGLTAASASDATPQAGDTIILNSGAGSFDPGTAVTVTFNGAPVGSGLAAGDNGNATTSFDIPAGLDAGVFIVVFRGTRDGATNVVGVCFEVQAALAGGGGGPATPPEPPPAPPVGEPISGADGGPVAAPERPSALPFTGSVELLAVAGLGAALVAVGAGTVVVARRRRDGSLTA